MSVNLRIAEAIQNQTLAPCRVAATSNLTLAGLQTVAGVVVAAGDRVLVPEQTDATENGIYVVSGGTWVRSTDLNGSGDLSTGAVVAISEAQELWQVSFTGTFSAGVTEFTWVRLLAALRAPVTAANLADATHSVNTTNKYAGLTVPDSTNTRLMITFGPSATSTWYVADGSASITPS